MSTNSESDRATGRVGHIVGSCSNSAELNDSGDQTADSQREQEAEETIPESSTSRYGRKRTRVLRENYEKTICIHSSTSNYLNILRQEFSKNIVTYTFSYSKMTAILVFFCLLAN